jgi:hypothetical protein
MTIDSVTYKKGQIIDVTSTGFLNSIDVTSDTTVDIDLDVVCAAVTGLNVKILISAKVQKGLADPALDPIAKVLEKDRYVKFDAGKTPYVSTSTSFSLGITDVLDVVTITASNNADYTTGAIDVSSDFVLDNGQRDNFYGFSKILKKPTSALDLSTYRYLSVKVDYFSRAATSGQPSFSVIDSYPVSTAASLPTTSIRYQQVPIYSSSLGTTYDLRDSLDFRPYAINTAVDSTTLTDATINPVITEIIDGRIGSLGLTMPIPIKDFTTDIRSYLAQAYRVVLDPSGEVVVLASPQSEQIELPSVSSKMQMTLATFFLKPYPSLTPLSARYWNRKDYSINVNLASNPAYTMKSIGALEQRISNLEYYTALNSIEQQAKDTKFLDSSGIERFKNGLLVDAFSGHGVGHVGNPDYKISIDTTKRELRAYFNDDVINWKPFSSGAANSAQTGDVFHIPYHELVYTQQLQASKYEEIVTELLVRDDGSERTLPPESDPPITIPSAGTRQYTLVRTTGSHVDEGQLITIELNTINVPENTTVAWTVSGISAADLSSGATTGIFTVSSGGTASATWRLANDGVTEGSETFTLTLDPTDSDGSLTGATPPTTNITVNDTSTTGPGPEPVCVLPYVLNAAGTDCIAPACGSGYSWNPTSQTCELVIIDPKVCVGNLTITPEEQNDIDMDYVAPVYKNVDGTYDQFEYPDAGWNFGWGDWSKVSNRATGATETEGTTESLSSTSRGEKIGTEYGDYMWGEAGYTNTYTGTHVYQTVGTYSVYDYGTQEILNKYERIGNYIWGGQDPDPIVGKLIGEVTVWDNYKPYCKATNITWRASGLCPGTTHVITINGRNKGSKITDSSGRASGSFNIDEGELQTSGGSATGYEVKIIAVNSVASTNFSVYGFGTIQTGGGEIERIMPPAGSPKSSIAPSKETKSSSDWTEWTGPTTTYKKNTGEYWLEEFNDYETPEPEPAVETIGTDTNAAPGTEVVGSEEDGEPVVTVPKYGTDFDTTIEGPGGLATEVVADPGTNYGTPPTVEPIADAVDPYTGLTQAELDAIGAELDYLGGNLFGGEECDFGWDPMAQTFIVEGFETGMFVSSVDIFFHRVGREEDNNGVTLEIREVINGYPGPEVIARRHKARSECSSSTLLASGLHTPNGTKFTFNAPVFLENGKEYCIVPIPDRDDPNYFVWIGELGAKKQGTDTIINKQAHTGMLFTSANNRTWTPRQKEDLMFRINRATFKTNTNFEVNLNNDNEDWLEFDTFSTGTEFELGTIINGLTFDITAAGTGYSGTPTVAINDGSGRGSGATATLTTDGDTITAITLTNPGAGYLTNPSVVITGGDENATITATLNRGAVMTNRTSKYNTSTIRVTDGYFTVGDLVGNGDATANITTIHNRVINDYALMGRKTNMGDEGTFIPKIALTATGAASVNTTLSATYWETPVVTSEERTVYSYSNEQVDFSGAKSVTAQIILSTPSENLSPMVNVESMNMRTFTNYINNTATNENGRNGGDAYSKYISKRVTLADGQDAEDFKVYLDNKIPSTGSVKVYCKLINISDDADFLEDIYWNEMEVEQSPPNLANEGWAEWLYKLPLKASGFGLNGSGILEYDVDRVGSIGVTSSGPGYTSAPGVKIEHSGTGYGATAVSVITGGEVTNIDMLDPGRGYTGGGGTITVTVGDQYENSTAYSVGDQIQADGDKLYTCVTAGTSAAGGAGPTGIGPGITEGTLYANSTAYLVGDQIQADGNLYICVTAGTSAAGGAGPTGTGAGITDGTAVFDYVSAAAVFDYASAAAVVGTVTTNTVTYSGFKKYAVKIVHLSSDTSKIPKTTNLRAYALQV